MTTLQEVLSADDKVKDVVASCCQMIDEEVAEKSGVSGLAIKAGDKAVKGIKPGFIQGVVYDLLPEFASALDPLYQEAKEKHAPVAGHFASNSGRMADLLLAITDGKAQRSTNKVIKGTYGKLRKLAKKNVEAAAPRVGRMIEQHAP